MTETQTIPRESEDESQPNTGQTTSHHHEIPFSSRPTIRPSLIWLGITLLSGVVTTLYVTTNTGQFGGPDAANIIANVIVALTVIGVLRFLIRIFILTRTQYLIDNEGITREYTLLLESRSRRIPHSKIRSHELHQSRIQKLLGYGTIAANQGLGELELENVSEPHTVYQLLEEQVD